MTITLNMSICKKVNVNLAAGHNEKSVLHCLYIIDHVNNVLVKTDGGCGVLSPSLIQLLSINSASQLL